MSKVRVYELAKELNMKSKDLVDRLMAAGLDVKNYMSTLDEETIARAKDIISGALSEVIEEKRIKPTVIRRRKKTVRVEPESPLPEMDQEEVGVPVGPGEIAPLPEGVPMEIPEPFAEKEEKEMDVETETKPVQEEIIPVSKTQETQEISREARPVQVKAKEWSKEKTKKAKKRRSEEPARIIKRPEEGPLKDMLVKRKEEGVIAEAKPPIPVKVIEIPSDETEKEKADRRKEKKGVEKKEDTPRSFLRHRKLEVFERADLYEGRLPHRKERKTEKKIKEVVKRPRRPEVTPPKPMRRKIKVPETVTVTEIARAMGVKGGDVIKKLMSMGVMASMNQVIDYETASLMADEFGYELELDFFEVESLMERREDKPEDLRPRPPVVTIMGHVDHGKTSLLDFIRKSNIISSESGGITQHIGAYYVKREGGDVAFLDTPGHEAFTAMRARGAKVTDIIVLVVAADDGVMPQTVEAMNHGMAAHIPIIVAINKIDKPEANLERVRRQLADLGLVPEEWGGSTIFGLISAKTGQGVDEFLELIQLQAEILELKANPNRSAIGTIVEARLDKSKGALATVLIKNGTLKQGDYFVCGEHYGKVRAMMDHFSRALESAGPSVPVEIYGISGVPMAGDEFRVVRDEKTAKNIIDHRKAAVTIKDTAKRDIVNLDDLYRRIKEGEVKELNIILKADVQGSAEALSEVMIKLSAEEVKLKIIHASTGGISESDVMLASASNAIIIGFNVRANPRVMEIAENESVDIRYYDVIYDVIKDIRSAMVGLLEPIRKEKTTGHVGVLEIFHIPKVGTVAGSMVTDGYIERNAHVRLLRDGVVIYDGRLASLKRFKDDVKEVQSGYECGIALENFQDIKPGDIFEAYIIEEIEAEL